MRLIPGIVIVSGGFDKPPPDANSQPYLELSNY